MCYPYTNKFVSFNDIAESMNGFVRIIEFRCFSHNGRDNRYDYGVQGQIGSQADPTIHAAHLQNWVLRTMEGNFKLGRPNGFCRTIHAVNGHCEQGYYKDGVVQGKYSKICLLDD